MTTSTPSKVAVFWTTIRCFSPHAIAHLAAELSCYERRRAEAHACDDSRRTYIVAHVLLRRVLGEKLGGKEPLFFQGPGGRPELALPHCWRQPLSFNLTHTLDFAACATLDGAPVGIDAEDIRRSIDIEIIASRWFAASERRWLDHFSGQDRINAFFRIWTLKEAILKATGHGLRIAPQRIAIQPETSSPVIPGDLGIPTEWRLTELAPVLHVRVALAVPGHGAIAPSLTHIDLA